MASSFSLDFSLIGLSGGGIAHTSPSGVNASSLIASLSLPPPPCVDYSLITPSLSQEEEQRAFKERQRAAEAVSESKTSKNRLKREKKKARAKGLPPPQAAGSPSAGGEGANGKKRKLEGGGGVGGKGMVFKQRKGDDDEDDSDEREDNQEEQAHVENTEVDSGARAAGEDEGPASEMASGPAEVVYDQPTIVIHEDD